MTSDDLLLPPSQPPPSSQPPSLGMAQREHAPHGATLSTTLAVPSGLETRRGGLEERRGGLQERRGGLHEPILSRHEAGGSGQAADEEDGGDAEPLRRAEIQALERWSSPAGQWHMARRRQPSTLHMS